jgi:hypothetical protein
MQGLRHLASPAPGHLAIKRGPTVDYDVDGLYLSLAVMLVLLWAAGEFFWNFGNTIWILLPVAVLFGALAWALGEDAG